MDFGDLIVKALLLFRKRPNILKQYQKQFKYVLVDEFQDTNYAQNELAILLAGKGKNANITVTGDDDQSIYRFRGAAVSNIIQFRKTYPKAKIVVLTKNYRSTQEILDKAYQLIQHNNPDRLEAVENVDKKLKSDISDKGEKIRFIHVDRVENEAEKVVKEIKKLRTEEKNEFKDYAILVRANNHSEPFIRAFQRHSIPYQFLGPGRLFKQPEIVDLTSYLKVLYNFEDSVALFRLLSIDEFNNNARDLARIGNYAKRYNLSLFDACLTIDEIYVSEETRKSVNQLTKLIEKHLKLVRKETAGQILYYFLEDLGLMKNLLNPDTVDAEKKAKNISKFFDKLKTYEVDHEDATIPAVVDWIELTSELGESPLAVDTDWTEINAVNILTVHSAKGLEFPVVFLVNLVGQRFPTIERREQIPIPDELIKEVLPQGDYHLEEERRLFYVGMTRAMDRLYFTAADYYGEGKREKHLSPFIFESLGDEAISAEQPLVDDNQQLTFLDYEPKTKPSEVLTKEGEALHIDFLSYSQIQTFEICPLHYKLRYILKIPTPPSAALSFGSTIHAVMRDFYNGVRTGSKPTTRLLNRLLEDNWVAEGYSSKAHMKKMFEKGKEYLRLYFKKEFNLESLPVSVELPFVVPLSKRLETGIQSPLKIGGKFDRIDKLSGGIVEIIDYKTGERVPEQKDVNKDLQLTFYALAATKIPEAPFISDPSKIKLSLYYFEEQKKISTTKTIEQLKKAEEEIFNWRKKIEESDFTCSKHFLCENCEYKLFCQSDE